MLDLAVGLRGRFSDAMLPVEAVPHGPSVVYAIDDPVSVVLHRGSEYHDLVVLAELCQKLVAVWSDHVEEVIFAVFKLLQVIVRILVLWAHKVYQSLVEVQDQRVWLVQYIFCWQEWRMDFG